ncbi:MAG: sigma-54-dependent Fis family transcriptional regulator [Deltaproteobacteria bacterium]|nr:sigma-54-dependent Fis family transcriptional regulator [Deltaproteobacteria bacterium]
MDKKVILIVEDDSHVGESLRLLFKKKGYSTLLASNGKEGLHVFRQEAVDLMITDVVMPKMGGLELLEAVKGLRPETEVIVISAQGTIEKAVQAMKLGAFDFIEKPINPRVISLLAERALEKQTLILQNRDLRSQLEDKFHFRNIIGRSEKMVKIFELIRHIALYDSSVLIIGESGTGKELIANAIHYNSPRTAMPFIKVSCASLSEGIIESELFGHEKGAFTGAIASRKGRFEMAHQGTLFLDEVEDIPLSTQIKLLRVLQEGEFERVGGNKTLKVNIRIIAASNRDLQEAVKVSTFREDLYYRLNVVNIKLPPLRERKEDIPFLIQFLTEKFNKKYKMKVKGVSQRAMNLLMDYSWSGNVRELENTIESSLVINTPEVLDLQHLPQEIRDFKEEQEVISFKIGTPFEDMEREMLLQTLKATKGNKQKAAKLLGINVRTIHRKMEEIQGDPST